MIVLGFIAIALWAFGLGFWLTNRLERALERRQNPAALPLPQRDGPDPSALDRQVQGLLAQGKAIEAIKLVRQSTGWNLSTSKAYVDRLKRLP